MSTPSIEYRNNDVFNNFIQSENGMGLSNFRANNLPTINRTTTDFQLENANQYTNPIAEYESRRHSDFLFSEHYRDFKLIDQQKVPDNYIYLDLIKTFQERDPLMDFFFSKKNLDHLQYLIYQMILYLSAGTYKISRQSDPELLTVMRSIYIKTPTNPYADDKAFKADICTLNTNVLDWVVPRIIVNIQQYLGFVRDLGQVRPLSRPEYMSDTGNRINRGFDVTFI